MQLNLGQTHYKKYFHKSWREGVRYRAKRLFLGLPRERHYAKQGVSLFYRKSGLKQGQTLIKKGDTPKKQGQTLVTNT